MTPKYQVRTWDTNLQAFTPQDGCPEFVTGPNELRRALRTLQSLGYICDRDDNAVLVERVEDQP